MKKKANVIPSVDFFPEFTQIFKEFGCGFGAGGQGMGSCEEIADYLVREERILTLARKKYQRALGDFSLPYWEEKLYSEIPEKGELLGAVVKRISRVVTRPLLREMSSITDAAATTLLKLVEFPSITVSFSDVSVIPASLYRSLRGSFKESSSLNEKDFLVVTLEEDGKKPIVLVGAKDITHTGKFKNCYFLNHPLYFVTDLADFFSYLAVYVQVMKEVSKIRAGEDSVYKESFEQCIEEFRQKFIEHSVRVDLALDEDDTKGRDIRTSVSPKYVFSDNAWEELTASYINLRQWDGVDDDLRLFMQNRLPNLLTLHDRDARKELENGRFDKVVRLQGESAWHEFLAGFILESHVPYRTFCCRWRGIDSGYSGMPHSKKVRNYICEDRRVSLLADLFYFIAKEKYQLSQMAKHYRDLDSDYAKSFISKKLNVQKVKEAMQNSVFNEYFGFVEFDEETDLLKAEEVAREFKAVKDTYLKGVNSSENAIRFRKLGQHKALGLYYPRVACLCVDIRSPESLAHEYGHLIDYTYGNLSLTAEFKKIRDLYENEFDSYMANLPDDDSLKKVLKGNTKYNKSYYLKATEVFARCFELYLSVCVGVKNSIVPNPASLKEGIYPQTGLFLDNVKSYFDTLLKNLENEKVQRISIYEKAAGL